MGKYLLMAPAITLLDRRVERGIIFKVKSSHISPPGQSADKSRLRKFRTQRCLQWRRREAGCSGSGQVRAFRRNIDGDSLHCLPLPCLPETKSVTAPLALFIEMAPFSTAIRHSLDFDGLRTLAHPWPSVGGGR